MSHLSKTVYNYYNSKRQKWTQLDLYVIFNIELLICRYAYDAIYDDVTLLLQR